MVANGDLRLRIVNRLTAPILPARVTRASITVPSLKDLPTNEPTDTLPLALRFVNAFEGHGLALPRTFGGLHDTLTVEPDGTPRT